MAIHNTICSIISLPHIRQKRGLGLINLSPFSILATKGEIMENDVLLWAREYGIFAVLFLILFYDTRKETKKREEKLMTHIEKSDAHIEKSDITLSTITQGIAGKLEGIDTKVTNLQKDVEILKIKE